MGRVLGGFGEGLGRVWGGFWEGFGKVWEPFGRSRGSSALFLDFAGLCWSFLAFSCSSLPFLVFPSLFSPLLAFAGLCWPLLGFNACYYCWGRAKRASKASERSSLVLALGLAWSEDFLGDVRGFSACSGCLMLFFACFFLISGSFFCLCWMLCFAVFLVVLSSFLAVFACCYCWGASEASEQSERAKLSGAFSGFPLLTHAFAGVPLLSLAFCCFASLHVVWHFLLSGTLAFPHSFSLLFLAVPCLLLFSLVLPCTNIS